MTAHTAGNKNRWTVMGPISYFCEKNCQLFSLFSRVRRKIVTMYVIFEMFLFLTHSLDP